MREETGFDVVPTGIAFLLEDKPERWDQARIEICFYAEIVGSTALPHRTGEIKGCEWRALSDPGSTKGRYALGPCDVPA